MAFVREGHYVYILDNFRGHMIKSLPNKKIVDNCEFNSNRRLVLLVTGSCFKIQDIASASTTRKLRLESVCFIMQ